MAPGDDQSTPAKGAVKHRACDECRSRKLACSKEPAGCSRCLREGIACHYSPQKQMGRPRKRRLVEEIPADEDDAAPVAENVYASTSTYTPNVASTGIRQPGHDDPSTQFALDSSLNFLNQPSDDLSNLDFLDLLPYGYDPDASLDPRIFASNDGVTDANGLPFALGGGPDHLLGDINFDMEQDSSLATAPKPADKPLRHHWNPFKDRAEVPEPGSSDNSISASSPESHSDANTSSSASNTAVSGETPKAIPSVSCGCLSSLYLALDALSRLPPDIPSAMRVARNSTKVAHDVIQCPQCSAIPIHDAIAPPPIQSFQNMMCIAALIPSACNAYAGILEMVDKERDAAKEGKRQILFSMKELGCINDCDRLCSGIASFNNRKLDPDLWRNCMRAILRADVYGLEGPMSQQPTAYYNKRGLKDVLRLMEERSRTRHAKLDELYAQGKVSTHSHFLMSNYKPQPVEQRNCMTVMEAARTALDNLTIS
jgi:hypothetical protein